MADWTETQITTKVSPRSVTDTVSRLTGMLSAKGLPDPHSRARGEDTSVWRLVSCLAAWRLAWRPHAGADGVPSVQMSAEQFQVLVGGGAGRPL